ncbi:MAG TPA: phospholipid carrier-dependent glycosyltransferase, partial [Candidatus Eisenbacteria bacterium]
MLLLDPRAQGAILAAGAALVILARAGVGPLANYDDAYYAEKAKQMLRTGDWLTPRFGGVERLDNPPLFLWLMAGSFAVLGVTSFAAVLWSALAGVGCVVLTHRLDNPPLFLWLMAGSFAVLGVTSFAAVLW